MNKKGDRLYINHKSYNSNNPIESFNNLNPNRLPNADDYMNIINDSDSEQMSEYEEEKIKVKQLKNDNEENITVYKTEPKIQNKKKEKRKKELNNTIEIEIYKDNDDSDKERDNILPEQYLYDKIKNEIFPKMNLKKEIIESFILDENLQILEKNLSEDTNTIKQTRKRGQLKLEEEKNKKKGRKKNNEPSDGKHNKDSQDNIIKKIKSKLLDYLLKFINNLLNTLLKIKLNLFTQIGKNENLEKEKIIKKIDYKKIVDDMKRENNLNFLKMNLKELLSNDISSKYSTYSKDINKKIIDEILIKENDNKIIILVFNLTFIEWIDIFTYKKEIKDIKALNILNNESKNIINNTFERADKLLEEIYQINNERNYFSRFVSILYNYERWFLIKKGRQRKDKNEKKEDEKWE